MSSPSNLYAEKIYAEQPIALWSLDDDCSFISYFSPSSLDLSTWSGALITDLEDTANPFARILNSSFVKITVPHGTTVTITAPQTVTTKESFSAGMWINAQSAITSVTINTETLTSASIDMSGLVDQWKYVGQFFEVSSSGISSKAVSISITNSTSADADVYLNGFSIGFNQNYFGSYTTGKQLHQITSEESAALQGLYGIEASQYGIGEYSGWYIGNSGSSDKKKKVYARNSSVPLVYGTSSSTIIYENPTGPSLVVPGMGFLNESGAKQNITFEAWMRIKTDGVKQANPFRILGPLGSSDGLYVNGQHLILKIGNSFASHYVGEWMRPMLINIDYSPKMVRLILNGEVVCSIDIDNVSLASIENPYIGFYAGGNVQFIEIDCIAVYPYRMNPILAKRRIAYAQAVRLPSEIETAYSGKQASIDYTFARYSGNYAYPKNESWSSSTADAAYVNTTFLGSPLHQKPEIVLSDKSAQDTWESDMLKYNKAQNSYANPFIKILLPQQSSTSGYIYFRTLRQESIANPKSFYIVMDHPTVSANIDETLFRIQNPETLDSIVAIRTGSTVTYYYNISGKRGTLASFSIYPGKKFVVGLSDGMASKTVDKFVTNFISSMHNYKLFVGGDYAGSDNDIAITFSGNIYKVAIQSEPNNKFQGLPSLYTTSAIPDPTKFDLFDKVKSTYEYKVSSTKFNDDYVYELVTSSVSYWTDAQPLAKFAKKVTDESGKEIYVTDMIQVSIDVEQSSVVSSGTIDSSDMSVKSYIYFSKDIPSKILFSDSLSLQKLPESKVIDVSSSYTNWTNKKFEVVDGTVIFPPINGLYGTQKQKDLYMGAIIELYSDDTERLPIKVKYLQYASQTFNRQITVGFDKRYAKKISSSNGIVEAYMFSESSGVYSYSAKNPLAISKSISQYLYSTNRTGIKILDAYTSENDRGVYIPVNENGISAYYISTMTFYAMYNDNDFKTITSFIELYDNDRKYRIVCKKLGNTSKKAYLSIESQNNDGTWSTYTSPEFYINGILTPNPTINVGEWNSIGISFASQPLNMSTRKDFKIEIVGSLAINNIAYFQLRPEELAQQILPKEWNKYDTEKKWSDLDTFEIVGEPWSQVAADKGSIKPALTPAIVSSIYYGTNKIIAMEDADLSGIGFQNFEYDILQDVVWQKTITTSP